MPTLSATMSRYLSVNCRKPFLFCVSLKEKYFQDLLFFRGYHVEIKAQKEECNISINEDSEEAAETDDNEADETDDSDNTEDFEEIEECEDLDS